MSINDETSEEDSSATTTSTTLSVIFLLISILLQCISETIVFPSIWFFLAGHFEKDQRFLGWVVAAYSIGRGISYDLLWKYFKHYKTPKYALYWSMSISLFGSTLYSLVDRFPGPPWWMLAARFLIGFSSGTAPLYGDYLAHLPGEFDKSIFVAPVQGVGLFLGPILGFSLSFMNFHLGKTKYIVDAETSAGYLIAILTVVNMLALAVVWKFIVPAQTHNVSRTSSTTLFVDPPHPFLLFLALFAFFVMGTVFSTFETILPLVTDYEFGWGVKQNGILFTCIGVGTIIGNLIASFIFPRFEDRLMAICGYGVAMTGYLIIIRWPGDGPPLPLAQFLVGTAVISASYPFTYSFVMMYTKLMHPAELEQKSQWMPFAGTLARIIGPVWAGYAFYYGYYLYGHGYIVIGNVMLLAFAAMIVALFYRKLRPHQAYSRIKR